MAASLKTLPPGFVLDAPINAGLPPGFVLDKPTPAQPQAPEMTWGETAADVASSFGTGVVRGVAGLAGMPADIARGLTGLAIRGGGYLVGADQAKLEEDIARANAAVSASGGATPTSAEIMQRVEETVGPMYTPRGTAGQYAETVGEFAPSAFAGPGGVVRKAAMAVVPGVMSEAAGQAAEGSDYETAARIAGGLVGGVAMAGRGSGAAKAMQKAAPDLATVDAQKSSLYKTLEKSGIQFGGKEYSNLVTRVSNTLKQEAFDPDLQPKTAVLLRRMQQLSGKSPTFQEMDNLRKMAGNILRGSGEPSDKQFASKIMSEIDGFFDKGKVTSTNPNLPVAQIKTSIKDARELSRRSAIARDINAMNVKSPYYAGGIENRFRAYMKTRKGERLTEAEKNAFDAVALRESIADYASSKAGPAAGGAVGFLGGGGPVGAVVGAGLTAGGQAIIKKIADAATAKQVDAALKTALAGRGAQNKMLRDAAIDAANNRLRAIIAAGMTVQSAESNRNSMAR